MLWVLIRSTSLVLLMSTHNICFCGEIRTVLIWIYEACLLWTILLVCHITEDHALENGDVEHEEKDEDEEEENEEVAADVKVSY